MLSEVCTRYRNVRSLREHARIVFNRTEGKLEVVILKEYESVRMVPKPLCSDLFNCSWAIEVSIETKYSSPPNVLCITI
jgi:ASC-1-like (ASCH) protein